MSCRIITKNNKTEVFTPFGDKSMLFESIQNLPEINSDEEALKVWAKVYTTTFKKWFGDWESAVQDFREGKYDTLDRALEHYNVSKMLDKNGEPLLVYHNTNNEFDEFDVSRGAYFSNSASEAENIYKGDITSAYILNVKTLRKTDISNLDENRDLLNKAVDGYTALNDRVEDAEHNEYVVFDNSKIFPIISQDTKTLFNQKLRDTLLDFVKGLNVEVSLNEDELLESLDLKGGDPLAAFDTLQKYLALSSNVTDAAISNQTANIIYTFLGKKSKLSVELWKNINTWSDYEKTYNYYNSLQPDIESSKRNSWAHKQTIIAFISEILQVSLSDENFMKNEASEIIGEKRNNPDLNYDYFKSMGYRSKYEKNWIKKIINELWNWINKNILGKKAVLKLKEHELKTLALDIADDVVKKKYDKFIRNYIETSEGKGQTLEGEDVEQKFYQETLNQDPFAAQIIDNLFKNELIDYKLSGSQVVRKYGKLLRPVNETLHDIDGVITLNQFEKEKNHKEFLSWIHKRGLKLMSQGKQETFQKEIIPFLNNQIWYKELKKMYPSWNLDVAFIGRDHKKGESITITGTVDHPTKIDLETGKPEKFILDFFLRTQVGNYPEIFDNYWKDWKQIFEAKLYMGRSKDINDLIYFDPFTKDKYKFTNKGFRYFSFEQEEDIKNLKISEVQQKKEIGNAAIAGMANKLSKSLGIPYKIVTELEADKITANTQNPRSNQPAFYHNGVVYFVSDRITSDLVFHEFSHPFITSLRVDNPNLYNKLLEEVKSTPEGAIDEENAQETYAKLTEDYKQNTINDEILVGALNRANTDDKKSLNIIEKILYNIKRLLRKIFGKSIKISKLNTNTSLLELTDILKSDQFTIDTAIIKESDVVSYAEKTKEFVDEILDHIGNSKSRGFDILNALTVDINSRASMLHIAKDHISSLRKLGKEELLSVLYSEENSGLYASLTSRLNPIEDPNSALRQKLDEIDFTIAHTEALVNNLFTIDKIIEEIVKYVKNLKNEPDQKYALKQAGYYNKILGDWLNFITEGTNALTNSEFADVPTDTRIVTLLDSMKSRINHVQNSVSKVLENAIDPLFETLIPTIREIQETKAREIKELEEDWVKGGKKAGIKRKLDDKIKEKEASNITRERLLNIIKGKEGDANMFRMLFDTYLANPDPVVGGFAVWVKNQLTDAQTKAQKLTNNMMHELNPKDRPQDSLLKKIGFHKTNIKELASKILDTEKVPYKDPETGEILSEERHVYLSQHKGYQLPLAILKENKKLAKQELAKDPQNELLKESYNKADQALKAENRDYMHQQFVPEFYTLEKELEDASLNNDIVTKLKLEQEFIFEKLNKLQEEVVNPEDVTQEHLDDQKALLRQYHALYNKRNPDNTLKSPKEIEAIKIISEHREKTRKFYEPKEIPNKFTDAYENHRDYLLNVLGLSETSKEYKKKLDEWINSNTRVVLTEEYFEEIQKLIDRLAVLMKKTGDNPKISELYERMISLTKGYRDNDNQIIGIEIPNDLVPTIKKIEEEIEVEKNKVVGSSGLTPVESDRKNKLYEIKNSTGRLSKDQQRELDILNGKQRRYEGKHGKLNKAVKGEIRKIISEFDKLRSKEPTEYYLDVLEDMMSTVDKSVYDRQITSKNLKRFLEREILLSKMFKSSPAFEKWFKANHIKRRRYNQKSQKYREIWEPLYIWSVTKPNNPKHYKSYKIKNKEGVIVVDNLPRVPQFQYYRRHVKKEYKTPIIPGVTVHPVFNSLNGNKDQFLPRPVSERDPNLSNRNKYINQKYNNLKQDPNLFKVLEILKKYHFKAQEGLDRSAQLGLEFPRYRHSGLEILQSGNILNSIKKAAVDLKDSIADTEDRYMDGFNPDQQKDRFGNPVDTIKTEGLFNLPIDKTSVDIFKSMGRYIYSSSVTKKLTEVHPIAAGISRLVENNDPELLKEAASGAFKRSNNIVATSKKERKIREKSINNIIEQQFYGQNLVGPGSNSVKIGKVMNILMGLASHSFFAADIQSALKNRYGAMYQNTVEAIGGKYVTVKSLAKGRIFSTKVAIDITSSVYKNEVKSLNQQLVYLFDVGQKFQDKIGDIGSRSLAMDAAGDSSLYAFRKLMEWEASIQLFAGMAEFERTLEIKTPEGTKKITPLEAYELVDGNITLKEGVDPEWTPGTGKKFLAFKNKVHEVTRRLQGAYSGMDKMEIERYLWARPATFLRRYLIPMMMNRWEFAGGIKKFNPLNRKEFLRFEEVINPALGTSTMGYHIRVLRTIGDMLRYGASNVNYMTKDEHVAWKKTLGDITMLTAILLLPQLLLGWDPDDPDRFKKLRDKSGPLPIFGAEGDDFNLGGWTSNHLLLLLMNIRGENEQFIVLPGFGLRSLTQLKNQVSVISGPTIDTYIKIIWDILYEIDGDSRGRYRRDVGPYPWQKEGHNKIWNHLGKLAGFKGTFVDGSLAVKNYQSVQARVD